MKIRSLVLDRLDAVWHKDRTYTQTLLGAALADSQRDTRIKGTEVHAG